MRADNCCHCSIRAFLIRAKLNDTTHILAGNLETDVGKVIYYVVADHAQRALVVAVRGSMSLQDVVTDAYAVPTPLDEHGLPGVFTHSGFAAAATWLRDDLAHSGVLESFFEARPDYALVVCGHSLGAATATVLAMLLRPQHPRLHCYAFAPPPTADAVQAEQCDEFVTSVVYDDDMICRLSLPAMRKLKDQMLWSFNNCPLRKWEVIGASIAGDASEPREADESQRLKGGDGGGGSSGGVGGGDASLFANVSAAQLLRVGDTPPASATSPVAAAVEALPSSSANPLPSSSSAAVIVAIEDHAQLLRPLFISGRIYHVLNTSASAAVPATAARARAGLALTDNDTCCAYSFGTPPTVVYPASRVAFTELIVSSHMFADHLPNRYLDCMHMLVPELPFQ